MHVNEEYDERSLVTCMKFRVARGKIRTRNLLEVQAEVSGERGRGNGEEGALVVERTGVSAVEGRRKEERRACGSSRDSSRASLQQFVDNI